MGILLLLELGSPDLAFVTTLPCMKQDTGIVSAPRNKMSFFNLQSNLTCNLACSLHSYFYAVMLAIKKNIGLRQSKYIPFYPTECTFENCTAFLEQLFEDSESKI